MKMYRDSSTAVPSPWDYWQPSGTGNYVTWQIWYTTCWRCGNQVSNMDKYCPHCGLALWSAGTTEEQLQRIIKKLEELLEEVRSLSEKAKEETD